MLVAALRRFVVLVVAVSALVAGASSLLGLLIGASLERAVPIGFYLVGSFLMVVGFAVGNRGPARVRSETGGTLPLSVVGTRRLRWATLREQMETISNSAVFVALGLILVLVGVAVDARYSII